MSNKARKTGIKNSERKLRKYLTEYEEKLMINKHISNKHIVDLLVESSFVYSENSLRILLGISQFLRELMDVNKINENKKVLDLLIKFLKTKIDVSFNKEVNIEDIVRVHELLRKELSRKNIEKLQEELTELAINFDKSKIKENSDIIDYNLLSLYLLGNVKIEQKQKMTILKELKKLAIDKGQRDNLFELARVKEVIEGKKANNYLKDSKRKSIIFNYEGNMRYILLQFDNLLIDLQYKFEIERHKKNQKYLEIEALSN
jgi:hypothetical protein